MSEHYKKILTSQFEAALCMLNQCIERRPAEHWEGNIASNTFRQVAYHTLFFVDFYLSPGENDCSLRELHQRGGDERLPVVSQGLSQEETLEYVRICRQQVIESLGQETSESLLGPSGFSYRPCSRAELHLYSLRHIQHHTGQLSAFLRRVDPALRDHKALPWVGSGWK